MLFLEDHLQEIHKIFKGYLNFVPKSKIVRPF